jgi:hypothetical protein
MLKIIVSRKAQAEHAFSSGYFVLAGFIFVVMAFVLLYTTNSYLKAFTANSNTIVVHTYAYRAINTCLAYQDSITNRFYPGIIDFNKYNQENLDKCYSNTSIKSFNIQLRDVDKAQSYDRILVGFGASMNILSYPVFIRYADGNISKGELLFGAWEGEG